MPAEGLGRAETILQAIGVAAERLLGGADWRAEAEGVLRSLGEATGTSRSYIHSVRPGEDGEVYCSVLCEWVKPGVTSSLDNPYERDFPLMAGGYGRWIETLGRGNLLESLRSEVPDSEVMFLESEDILSLLVVPVFTGGKWWGWIGFDETAIERRWTPAETDALRTAAGILGAAIQREGIENQRLQAEAKYRTLVEQLPSITYIASAGGDYPIIYISPQVRDLLGYSPSDWIKDHNLWGRLVHPEDRDRVVAETARHKEMGETLRLEYRMKSRWGRELWIHDESVLVRGEDGTPLHWQGIMLDVTDRKNAEREFEESEARYQRLIEQIREVIVYTDLPDEGDRTIYVSPQIERILGVTPQRWMDEPDLWQEMIHPDDRERVEREFQEYLQGGDDMSDYRLVREDGRVVWIRDRARTVMGPDGRRFEQGVFTDITEQKDAEEKAREAEAKYRALVENIPAATYVEELEGNGVITYISPRIEDLVGYSPAEWMADRGLWLKVVHPDDRDWVKEADDRAAPSDGAAIFEYRMIAKDGRCIWIQDYSAPVFDDAGKRMFWQGVMLDITEKKHAEEKAREAESRYRALVENMPAIAYTEALEGRSATTYVGPQVESVLGYTPEEWVSDPVLWETLIHPDDLERTLAANERADQALEPFLLQYRIKAKNGRYVWVNDSSVPVKDESGRLAYWQGVMIDITAQKETEERAHEADAKYKALVENIPGVTYIDSIAEGGGRIYDSPTIYISSQVETVLGYTPQEWMTDNGLWERILHPDDRDRVVSEDERTMETMEPFSSDYRVRAKDGRIVWLEDYSVIVRDDSGKPMYTHGVLFDITERKRSEELTWALEVERGISQKLREIDEMKTTFLTAVSHDVRAPLAVILGLAMTMEREELLLQPKEVRDISGRIAGQARRLDGLVSDMLDLERFAQGSIELDRRQTDLVPLLQRVVDGAVFLQAHFVQVDSEPCSAIVDPIKVERIVDNLLSNAARHTPEGCRVWISATRTSDGVIIAVDDDGPGVPEDLRESVFESFSRGEGSSGTGVGLSLVARFAELHGGRAWVEDREGGGASFKVLLTDPPSVD